MARKLRFGNALLCEHVAKGAGRRHTLVNAYTGEILVASFPANLMFGIYIEHVPDSEDPLAMTLSVKENGKEIGKIEAHVAGHKVGKPTVIVIQHMEMRVEEQADMEIVATSDGYRPTVVIKKRISQGEIRD